jgi:nucleoid DNA-binding protein
VFTLKITVSRIKSHFSKYLKIYSVITIKESKSMRKPIKEKLSKTAITRAIADATGLSSKQVDNVLSTQAEMAKASLMKGGSGVFVPPHLGIRLKMKLRPGRKAGKGMSFGKEVMLPARKAQTIIKTVITKNLKDEVNY